MPPNAAATGNAAELPVGEMADRKFMLDLQSDHQKENGQQAVIDPMQQGHAKGRIAERKAQGLFQSG